MLEARIPRVWLTFGVVLAGWTIEEVPHVPPAPPVALGVRFDRMPFPFHGCISPASLVTLVRVANIHSTFLLILHCHTCPAQDLTDRAVRVRLLLACPGRALARNTAWLVPATRWSFLNARRGSERLGAAAVEPEAEGLGGVVLAVSEGEGDSGEEYREENGVGGGEHGMREQMKPKARI